MQIFSGSTSVRRLAIAHTGATAGIAFETGATGIGEELVVHSFATGSGSAACRLKSATLRDSICWIASPDDHGVGVTSGGAGTFSATVRNVTAVATGASSFGMLVGGFGTNQTADAVNLIADGTSADVIATAGPSSTATATLSYSNYATESEPNAGTSVTNPGTNNNQIAPPSFVDFAGGNFHQAAGSPTIDAGNSAAASLGAFDIDDELRLHGSSVDIGADEFVDSDSDGVADVADACPSEPGATANGCPEPPPPDVGDTSPPDTTITGGPKAKTKKKTATITFSGTDARAVASFQCKLDSGSFESCASPKTYSRLKKGRHTVEVRSVDAAGNVDPTPATPQLEGQEEEAEEVAPASQARVAMT